MSLCFWRHHPNPTSHTVLLIQSVGDCEGLALAWKCDGEDQRDDAPEDSSRVRELRSCAAPPQGRLRSRACMKEDPTATSTTAVKHKPRPHSTCNPVWLRFPPIWLGFPAGAPGRRFTIQSRRGGRAGRRWRVGDSRMRWAYTRSYAMPTKHSSTGVQRTWSRLISSMAGIWTGPYELIGVPRASENKLGVGVAGGGAHCPVYAWRKGSARQPEG